MIPLRDNIQSRTTPLVNYALIAANVAVFLLFQLPLRPGDIPRFYADWALIPREFADWSDGVPDLFPFVTSIFLHGGFGHLIGNMLFLFIFGDNVEDRFGHLRYLLCYLLFGCAASVAHVLSAPASPVPTLGASGAIAGVMGAYLVSYPRARVLVVVPIFFFLQMFEIPALFFLPFMFLKDLLSGVASLRLPKEMQAGVAWWAHVGGFATGVAVTLVFYGGPVRVVPRRVRHRLEEWEGD
jgi:membrane associated rhomboid family serine protease